MERSQARSFSEAEAKYIQGQHVCRLATISKDGTPDVVPVSFRFEGNNFYVGGRRLKLTKKYWNVKMGRAKVCLVFDDQLPDRNRGVKVNGVADLVERDSDTGRRMFLRIKPEAIRSWGFNP